MAKRQLKRHLGFWDVLMFGVGGIVGAGIYAIIGQAAGLGGNMLWLSFALASGTAMLTALSYAEFVSHFPDAGGSYEYIKKGIGPKTALFMSIFMTFTGIVAAAAIAISFSEYFGRLLPWPRWSTMIGVILVMAAFNIFGSKHSSRYNAVATIITILGLLVVIGFSVPAWGNEDLLQLPQQGWGGIFAGAALIFFSYVGFEDLVKLAEETKEPKKNMPRAILYSGGIVMVFYVLIAVGAVSVMGSDGLSRANGPLSAVLESQWGAIGGTVLAVVALFATSKTILSNILGTSRLLYDVARDSEIPWLRKFTTISGIGNAPNWAILAITVVTILFGLIGDLKVVASISNIFIFIVFGMVNAALLRFRYKNPRTGQKDKVFRIAPNYRNLPLPTVLALATIIFLFFFNVINLLESG
ncbi:APC family permease [Maribacter sp. 2307ULW6-5]|uniref:APC family permease n=1 Tax=Maribacter sp. 2307ULW6-5 TaxID=3386275 RepID=UPI0039BCFFA6